MTETPEEFLSIGIGFAKNPEDRMHRNRIGDGDGKLKICQEFKNGIIENIDKTDSKIQEEKEQFDLKKDILDRKQEQDVDRERDVEISRESYNYTPKYYSLEDYIMNATSVVDLIKSEKNMLTAIIFGIKAIKDNIHNISHLNKYLNEKEFAMRASFSNLLQSDTEICADLSYVNCGNFETLLESIKNIVGMCSKLDRSNPDSWLLNIKELGPVNDYISQFMPLWKSNLTIGSDDVYKTIPDAIDHMKKSILIRNMFQLDYCSEQKELSAVINNFDLVNSALKFTSDLNEYFTSSATIDAIYTLKNCILDNERTPDLITDEKFNNALSFIYEFYKIVISIITSIITDMQQIIYLIEPESRANTRECL